MAQIAQQSSRDSRGESASRISRPLGTGSSGPVLFGIGAMFAITVLGLSLSLFARRAR